MGNFRRELNEIFHACPFYFFLNGIISDDITIQVLRAVASHMENLHSTTSRTLALLAVGEPPPIMPSSLFFFD